MGMKLELRPEHDVAAFHFFRRPDVEDLQWLPAVKPLRELLRRNLWRAGIRHGCLCGPHLRKTQRPPLAGAVSVVAETLPPWHGETRQARQGGLCRGRV